MNRSMKIGVAVLKGDGGAPYQVEDNPFYLVGNSNHHSRFLPDEGIHIEKAIQDAGLNTQRIDVAWPRDCYSNIGRTYYTFDFFKAQEDEISKRLAWLADGGCVIPGDDFVLVSSGFVSREYRPLVRETIEIFIPGKTIHFIQPYMLEDTPATNQAKNHIDTTVGCIPGAKVVTVEKRHYDSHKVDFEAINGATDYQIVPIDTGDEAGIWGNNYLVLDEKEKTVVANKGATRVNAELRNLGIEVIETAEPLHLMTGLGGSVRCATNRLQSPDLLQLLNITEVAGMGLENI